MADRMLVMKEEGLDEIIRFLRAGARGMSKLTHAKLDTNWDAAASAVDAHVHVESERLKLSGRHPTHVYDDIWTGEITYYRKPGIFELARGDSPSRNHPEGGHYFFEAAEPFMNAIEEIVNDAIDDYAAEARV